MTALQTSVHRSQVAGFAGQPALTGDPKLRRLSVINSVPVRAQVGTITVDTGVDATVYTWVINGISQSITSADDNTTNIAAQIAAKINGAPSVRGRVSAASAAAVVTLTAVSPGDAFTASDADANLTTVQATVANLEADVLRPGRWAAILGTVASEIDPSILSASVAAAAYLNGQVMEYTYTTFEDGVILKASITFDGLVYSAQFTSATNANTSAAGLRAALEQAVDDLPLTVSGADNKVIVTADDGAEFDGVIFFATAATTGVLTENANAGPQPGTSIAFGGIVQRHLSTESDDTSMVFAGKDGAALITDGEVFVELAGGASPALNAPVYVYVGAVAADRGKIYSAAAADRIKLPRSVARFAGVAAGRDGQTLAKLSLTAR